ncbi:MAG: erythromycin esterase family protein [Bdellovibrionales bacterium]
MGPRFENRYEAGKRLAEKLKPWSAHAPVILALPRGGVPVAYEIASQINGQFDVLLVKKIGAPGHEELALGAVAEGEKLHWNQEILSALQVPAEQLNRRVQEKIHEIEALSRKWRSNRPASTLKNRVVILVDDGLATGSSMMAAVQVVKDQKPERLIVAAPVASESAVCLLREVADEVVALQVPENFIAVGLWYKDFTQVEDSEVRVLLESDLSARGERLEVEISDRSARLPGHLNLPPEAKGLILFAHGSGSTHQSPRNKRVAEALHTKGFGTLLFDLLTSEEARARHNVFDIELLIHRLRVATSWARWFPLTSSLPVAYFGASTGTAAALGAASREPGVFAVVSRGGRPDLAEGDLENVRAPVLLIVGSADDPIIPLNEFAQRQLPHCELVFIPGAGHLFEEPGTMDKVIEYAGDWFHQCLNLELLPASKENREPVLRDLRNLARPLADSRDLDSFVSRMAGARVVMFGESTHGTEDFYRIRRYLSQRLIEEHGFSFIAVEGDWPDCFELNRYTQGKSTGSTAIEALRIFKRWPTWMWANYQCAQLMEWMKGRRTGFYGLDVYSLFESLAALRKLAHKLSPELAKNISATYSCFEPFERSETEYAESLLRYPEGCEEQAMETLRSLLRGRLEDPRLSSPELLDAVQNATVIRNAERYYRSMLFGGVESWNVRDQHMMETLDRLLNYHGEGAKAIVWAHNTHVGDYHATDMSDAGYVNIGGLAREQYGAENVYLVGLGTYEGETIAGKAWGAPAEVMAIPSARPGSYEYFLHQCALELGRNEIFLNMQGEDARSSLNERRGHRAIGVVYQTRYEAQGHNYVPTQLSRRYDGFIFVDQTRALQVLPGLERRTDLLPETWPSGH